MILGYDTPRPQREQYVDFERKLAHGLQSLGIDGLSLLIYGSYVRGDFDPGRSDIDGILVFPSDVVIPKKDLQRASIALREAQRGNHIPFQVTVADTRTMQDGRFNSYGPSFQPYFAEEIRILVGTDPTPTFRYELPILDEQTPLRFNLRKTRTGLFFAAYDQETDYRTFLGKFNKSLDAVSRGSKQILYMMDGQLRKNRFSASEAIRSIMPEVDIDTLLRIRKLYHYPATLDALYRRPNEVVDIWMRSVTFFEQMIKGYLDRVPHH